MTPDEWTEILPRIQGAYQHEVTPETAAAWYDELRGFTGQEVLDAARRVIREHFKFTVAAAYKAIDANHKEERDDRERYESLARQRVLEGKHGVPAPPEFKKALRVFTSATSYGEDGRIRKEAREEIDDLASRITDRGPAWVPQDLLAEVRDPSGPDP